MSRSPRVKPGKGRLARSRAVSAARRSAGGGRAGIYAGVAVIVVLVVVVALGVWASRGRAPTLAAVPPVRVSAHHPVGVREGVVVAEAPGAPKTVDAYEDFLCPICDAFKSQHVAAAE